MEARVSSGERRCFCEVGSVFVLGFEARISSASARLLCASE